MRLALLVFLTVTAVGLPLGYWWLWGRADVEHRIESFAEESRAAWSARADQLAARLTSRLEALRGRESQRPFYHYRNRYLNSDVDRMVRSPLATGTGDPLVLCHYQVTPDGTVELPTIPDDDDWLVDDAEAQRVLRERLQVWSPLLRAVADEDADRVRHEPVDVVVGQLEWHRLETLEGERLHAARYLLTRQGRFVQGFLLDPAEIERLLEGPWDRPTLRSGTARAQGQGTLQLPGIDYRVVFDPERTEALIAQRSLYHRRVFGRDFTITAALALLAAATLLAVAWRVETLAQRRADFAAIAAHELRTPLTGLQLRAELLADDLGNPERRQANAHLIAAETERLSRVVDNLLDVTRLERRRVAAVPRPIDLVLFVTKIVGRLRPVVEASGGTLELDVDGSPGRVFAEPQALTSIVTNLVDNASRHGKGGGGSIALRVAESGVGWAEVVVRDQGPGLPRRGLADVLLAPFRRQHHDTAGLGLGLDLCRRLARRQGGLLLLEPAEPGLRAVLRLKRA
ncbi:MAG: HAMP domain-containing sensor histidine kinase [Acidobacteriota bacterium]